MVGANDSVRCWLAAFRSSTPPRIPAPHPRSSAAPTGDFADEILSTFRVRDVCGDARRLFGGLHHCRTAHGAGATGAGRPTQTSLEVVHGHVPESGGFTVVVVIDVMASSYLARLLAVLRSFTPTVVTVAVLLSVPVAVKIIVPVIRYVTYAPLIMVTC